MSRSETLGALEEGLITESEALEQGGAETIEALYESAAVERIETADRSMREVYSARRGFYS